MKFQLVFSRAFKKSFKKVKRSAIFDSEKFEFVLNGLMSGIELPPQYRDHELRGKYSNYRECHIKPDLLLIYEIDRDFGLITIVEIGSHSELFG